MTTTPSNPPIRMPVLFVGHGSPMNAIEDNPWSAEWRRVGKRLPRPKAILCISAHWETWGTSVTAMAQPRTIHDFGGFPRTLFEAQYPAPGRPELAEQVRSLIQKTSVSLNQDWGLDHGAWSVLMQMFPQADIPVVQLSMDYSQPPQAHYSLAKEFAPLREQGVLILGSGNMVHNLGRVALKTGRLSDFNEPFGFDWALQANDLFKTLINERRHAELINYPRLGAAVQLSVPTPEHYLPLLYILALQREDEAAEFFNDVALAGSLTMTGVIIQ